MADSTDEKQARSCTLYTWEHLSLTRHLLLACEPYSNAATKWHFREILTSRDELVSIVPRVTHISEKCFYKVRFLVSCTVLNEIALTSDSHGSSGIGEYKSK